MPRKSNLYTAMSDQVDLILALICLIFGSIMGLVMVITVPDDATSWVAAGIFWVPGGIMGAFFLIRYYLWKITCSECGVKVPRSKGSWAEMSEALGDDVFYCRNCLPEYDEKRAAKNLQESTNSAINTYTDEGKLYFKEGNITAAIEQFEKVLLIDRKSYSALFNLGLCYTELEDYKKAGKYYKKAMQCAPTSSLKAEAKSACNRALKEGELRSGVKC